jgi:hypothetical protein
MAEWVEDPEFIEELVDSDEKKVKNKTRCLIIKHDSLENKFIRIIHSRGDGLAFRIWPAASLLTDYILKHQPDCLYRTMKDGTKQPRRKRGIVLELGAGVGTLGLLTASLGLRTIVTELKESVPALERSIKANKFDSERIFAMPLNWFESADADKVIAILRKKNELKRVVILLTDCTYWDSLFVPLASTIQRILERVRAEGGNGVALCGHERRQWKTEKRFFTKRLRQHKLEAETIHECLRVGEETNSTHEHSGGWNQRIYEIRLRKDD